MTAPLTIHTLETQPMVQVVASPQIDPNLETCLPHLEARNAGRYSLARAVRRLIAQEQLNGLEAEVSREIERRSGRKPLGFWLPLSAEVRATTAGTPNFPTASGTGGGSIPNVLNPTVIDVLRARSISARLGARIVPASGGTFSYPAKSATVSLGWFREGDAGSSTNATIDKQVTFTPSTTGAYVDVSRRALMVARTLEQDTIDDLLSAIAVELDRVAMNGSGANAQPLGLAQNPNIPVAAIGTNGGAPTRALLASMLQTVANANADAGALAWATTPNGRYKLQTTEKASGTGRYLWDDDTIGPLNLPAAVSNNLPSSITKGSGTNLSALIFGNWNDLAVATWGAVDVLVNPYLQSATGYFRVTAFLDADVQLRHNASFVKCMDMVTS